MYIDDRSEATGHLDQAWRSAAVNDMQRAELHIGRALDLLDHAVGQSRQPAIVERMVRRHVEEGRAAIAGCDVLGAMLATVAALDILAADLQANVRNLLSGSPVRTMRSCVV